MHHRRPTAALLVGQRRARAGVVLPHVLPELFEVVRRRHAVQPRLDLIRQRVVDGVHVGELGAAQRLAVPARDADAVQHVHEPHHVAIRHVGVPVLAGVRAADVFPVLPQVGQDADVRVLHLVGIGAAADRSLDLAEQLGKPLHIADAEFLVWEPQHAVMPERVQNPRENRPLQVLAEVDPVNRGAEHRACRLDLQHFAPPERFGAMLIGMGRAVHRTVTAGASVIVNETKQSPRKCARHRVQALGIWACAGRSVYGLIGHLARSVANRGCPRPAPDRRGNRGSFAAAALR